MTIEQVWPEWKTEKILGRGSFGTVYKCCKETGNEKEYSAIKVISIPRDDYEATEIGSESMTKEESKNYYKDIVDDFLNEIKILESLKGVKNIVNIYDSKVVEKEDGIGWQIFIRMELLTDFNTYSSDKKFTPEDVKKFAIDICNALIVCSEKRIIHRDIKPENIFVDDEGNYKLGDFGVAKQMEKTYASTIRGALNYIAPEVIAAKKYDSRADIYSLGLVMYKLLNNNRLPFLDPNKQIVKHSERQDAYERRMRGEKIPPLQNVDENLNEIILRCCEFKAENRYRTAAELKQALESRNAKDKSIGKFIKKHKLISAVALLLVISIVSGSVIVYKIRDNSLDISDKGETDTLQKSEEQVVAPVTEPKEHKYEIEYSGVVDSIYTHNGVDYCSNYYATEDGPMYFYAVAENKETLLTRQTCGDEFVIINDKIYYTVYDGGEEYINSEGEYFIWYTSSFWKMNLDGSEQEEIFSLENATGYPVYADEENVYYIVSKTLDEAINNPLALSKLYRYNIKEKKSYFITEDCDECYYSDGNIYFCGDFNGIGGASTYKYDINRDMIDDLIMISSGSYEYNGILYFLDCTELDQETGQGTKLIKYSKVDNSKQDLYSDSNLIGALIGGYEETIFYTTDEGDLYSYNEKTGKKKYELDEKNDNSYIEGFSAFGKDWFIVDEVRLNSDNCLEHYFYEIKNGNAKKISKTIETESGEYATIGKNVAIIKNYSEYYLDNIYDTRKVVKYTR